MLTFCQRRFSVKQQRLSGSWVMASRWVNFQTWLLCLFWLIVKHSLRISGECEANLFLATRGQSLPGQGDDGNDLCLCATFVFLGWWDTCEFCVNLVILWDLEDGCAVLDHPRQQVWPPWNLEDVLDVWQVICMMMLLQCLLLSWHVPSCMSCSTAKLPLTLSQLVVLLQVAEPLLGGGDVVALVLRDVLLAGWLELFQVLVGDVFRKVAEQRAVLRHGLNQSRRRREWKVVIG